jgi:hypothetical protein
MKIVGLRMSAVPESVARKNCPPLLRNVESVKIGILIVSVKGGVLAITRVPAAIELVMLVVPPMSKSQKR